MFNFSNAVEELNNYRGSEKKKTLIYNNKKYLVKFPDPIREKNREISCINNAFSEYIGSNIFKIIGFKVQNTILGIYNYDGKEKIVCACEDFTDEGHVLYEFENIALSVNPDKKIETELNDIMEVIDIISKMMKIEGLKEKFWDMFIIDSLIGNENRYNGDWGILLDKTNNIFKFAPIYDCGSCLNYTLSDIEIKELSEVEIKNIAINTYSCIKEDGKKINCMSYIKNLKNTDCNNALARVFNKINLNKINEFINNIEILSDDRKNFYKKVIALRYEMLEEVYKIKR